MPRAFLLYLAALVAVIPLALGVWMASGDPDLAQLASMSGTFLVSVGALLWIVGVDSRRRWPGRTFTQRLGRLFRFER